MARILYVSTSTTVGGAEKTLYTLATLVDPKVCEVAGVVSLKPKGPFARKLEAAGQRVYSFRIPHRAGLRDLQKLALVIHETRPDIVHAVMYQAIQLARAVKRLGYADYKLVSSPRVNYRTRGGFSLMIDGYLKKADDLLIAESEASRKYLIDKLDYDEKNTITIRNGVDIAGWTPSKKLRAEYREKINIQDDDILIGSVGRLDEQKGHVHLIEAVARLVPTHPQVKCVIIGEGPLHAELQGVIDKLGVGANIGLLGRQDEVPNWLAAMDIFSLPSLWEGLPNALLEAMALGLPVISSDCDGVTEIVSKDLSGLLVKPGDANAIYLGLQDLVSDPGLRQRLGESARRKVQTDHGLAKMIESYQKAYTRVLKGDQK